MADQEQVKKIKCPHCGWVRSVNVGALEDASVASVVLGPGEALKAIAEKIKAALNDAALDEANAWIDMSACPHCNQVYQYNVRTGERRP
jgi:uncharacterized protein (UPF0212 family)